MTLVVSGFPFFQGSYLLSHETVFSLSTKFSYSPAFQFGLCYPFLHTKKGLSSPVFAAKILVVEIFGCY